MLGWGTKKSKLEIELACKLILFLMKQNVQDQFFRWPGNAYSKTKGIYKRKIEKLTLD